MKNVSYKSYKLKISEHCKYINNTIKIYQELINYLIKIYGKEYSNLINLSGKEQLKLIEIYIHQTKNNNPKYKDFNKLFHKLPSYFRRSGIMEVIGIYSSFNTRFKEYLEDKELLKELLNKMLNNEKLSYYKTEKQLEKLIKKIDNLENFIKEYKSCPTFNLKPNSYPILYKNNMSLFNKKDILSKNKLSKMKMKLFTGTDWKYFDFNLKDNNQKSLKNLLLNEEYKLNNPKLYFRKNKNCKMYQIHLTFEKKNDYSITKENLKYIKNEKFKGEINIRGIDLGINEPITYHITNNLIDNNKNCTINLETKFLKKTKVFRNNTTKFNKKLRKLRKVKSLLSQLENKIELFNQFKLNLDKKDKNIILNLKEKIFDLNQRKKQLVKKFVTLNKQIKNYQNYFNNEIVNQFTKILIKHKIDYIFMENLDSFIKTNRYKEKFHYWNKGTILNLLKNRLGLLGIRYLRINPKNTSITCNSCTNVDKDNRLYQKNFICTECGHKDNRDKNRSKNIFSKGKLKLFNK